MKTTQKQKSSSRVSAQKRQANRVIFGVIAGLILLTTICIALFSLVV